MTKESFHIWMDAAAETIEGYTIRLRLVCKDTFSISIQCGASMYCYPRIGSGSDSRDYTEFELGYPSSTDITNFIKRFAENEADLTNTVYGYVPLRYIIKMLNEIKGELK